MGTVQTVSGAERADAAERGGEAAAVREELERLVAAPIMRNSERLIRFLRFVVQETLEGTGARLKESIIGMAVFDREPGYDPKVDSIVRVQARHLRIKLDAHYAGGGRAGELQIVLPKGGYTPEFRRVLDRAPEAIAREV